MYTIDGRSSIIARREIEEYQKLGWYLEPVVQLYSVDGRTTYVLESEVVGYENSGWYTVDRVELARNQDRIAPLVYSSNQCGFVTGVITWQYNDFIGTKADVGARVMLIQKNHIPLLGDESIFLLFDEYSWKDDPMVYCTKVDGMGNYYFDYIPAGTYYLLILSENTNESPDFVQLNKEIARGYLSGRISQEAIEKLDLNIGTCSFEIEEIEVKPNQTVRFSHDFGNTYI